VFNENGSLHNSLYLLTSRLPKIGTLTSFLRNYLHCSKLVLFVASLFQNTVHDKSGYKAK